jgi:hypothetical protein
MHQNPTAFYNITVHNSGEESSSDTNAAAIMGDPHEKIKRVIKRQRGK